ncbi:hypothetical protein [Paenibacillus fonticola]|uniref:hypothetical protein n=1 Tax=Paenibacillus fonticola TaxID=379896 RepID=UPI0003643A86|nr:hypothetical protein [Paenibacillus fonticola]
MNRLSKIGFTVIGAILVGMLAACSGTPNAALESEGQVQNQPQVSQQPEQEQSQALPQDSSPALSEEQASQEDYPENQELSEGMPATALEAAATVMRALKSENMDTLAAWADAEGIRFSPYGDVNAEEDLVISRDEVGGLMNETKKRVWRSFPGIGDQIEMTYAEYHKRFVYDADFIEEATIAKNKGISPGGEISNLNEVYPKDNYDFVEYYIEGSDPNAEVSDWRSLRLVFKKIGEDRALAGIIHDQWTP